MPAAGRLHRGLTPCLNPAVGLLYALLSLAILAVAFTRSTRSDRDFSDEAAQGIRWDGPVHSQGDEDAPRSVPPSRPVSRRPSEDNRGATRRAVGKSKDPEPPRRFGRAFRTSGVEVAVVSGLVLATQVALLGLLMAL